MHLRQRNRSHDFVAHLGISTNCGLPGGGLTLCLDKNYELCSIQSNCERTMSLNSILLILRVRVNSFIWSGFKRNKSDVYLTIITINSSTSETLL